MLGLDSCQKSYANHFEKSKREQVSEVVGNDVSGFGCLGFEQQPLDGFVLK
jgi:hypothetical protein